MSISKKKSASTQNNENKSLTSGDISGTASSFEGVISASAGESLNLTVQNSGIDDGTFIEALKQQGGQVDRLAGSVATIAKSATGAQTASDRILEKLLWPVLIGGTVLGLAFIFRKGKR